MKRPLRQIKLPAGRGQALAGWFAIEKILTSAYIGAILLVKERTGLS